MPCYTRMKTIYLRGLLWLYLLGLGYVVVSVEPGFLDFDNLPDTNFSCVGKVIGGYYADLETNCQMFHVCTIGQLDEPMDIRFLCLNGTVFDQETRVCERIDEVDCSKSEKFYSLNLELYGNTQPSIAEENAETDPPIIIKASTTTTTTTTQKPKPKTTKPPYFTTTAPKGTTKVISAHHFPISNSPDIRFNPEEINISLHPGSPPTVHSKTYQQQVYNGNDNKKIVVTTHTSYGTSEEKEDFLRVVPNTQRPQVSSTQKAQPQPPATPTDINYGFTYHQTENGNQDYTEPPNNYQYQRSNVPFRNGHYRTTTYRTEHIPTTRRHPYVPKEPTTYVSSVKTPTYQTYHTEKPQRLQLPIPLLPTLPPLTFSSPAPFSLGNHIETKRYTNEHQSPPRIIISASASVSDNSGRRLNYSLGTIGVTPYLEEPPKTYEDAVLDPFYHDVPKIKSRRKRQTASDANGEQAAVDVLKFLFDWYQTQQKSSTINVPLASEDITEINQELAPIEETPLAESDLFNKKNKFNIIGDVVSVTENPEEVLVTTTAPVAEEKVDTSDYVDDNYEAMLQATTTPKEGDVVEEHAETTTVEEVVTVPTTTTTTSRILSLMRSRARAHNKRVMKENARKYNSFLTNIKPRIRSRGRQRSTTEAQSVSSTTETMLLTTATPPTADESTTLLDKEEIIPADSINEQTLEETQSLVEASQHEEPLEVPISEEASTEFVHPEMTTTTEEVAKTETIADSLSEQSLVESKSAGLDDVQRNEPEPLDDNNSDVEEPPLEELSPLNETDSSIEEAPLETPPVDETHEDLDDDKESKSESTVHLENTEESEHDVEEAVNESELLTEVTSEDSTNEDTPTEATTMLNLDTTNEEEKHTTEEYSIDEDTTTDATDDTDKEQLTTTTTTVETTYTNSLNEGTTEKAAVTSTTETYVETTTVDIETTTDADTTATAPNLTPVETTTATTTTTTRSNRRRPRPSSRSSSSYRRPNSRHRFSTEITSRPTRRKPVIEDALTQSTAREEIDPTSPSTSTTTIEDVPATDAPLFKSANPTQAESLNESLHTTPLSMYKVQVRKEKIKSYIFNCFGKPTNKFYSDPRDCRLFHYCTSGYTKNQLLDMKFVCDLGTFFDDERLICTKVKPERCL